mmetsp:Transcript_6608/g.16097  ORF Transcript_6608/g.16097 Transcript_6608/m.16097 type:complete len:85 (-) Transcript_6608:1078-1332(-)
MWVRDLLWSSPHMLGISIGVNPVNDKVSNSCLVDVKHHVVSAVNQDRLIDAKETGGLFDTLLVNQEILLRTDDEPGDAWIIFCP